MDHLKAIIPKKLANELGVDLIMCGTSGLNAVERFIVGSVSEAIVRHAPCDVLVVRTEEIQKISNLKLQLLNLENNFLNKVMYVNKEV